MPPHPNLTGRNEPAPIALLHELVLPTDLRHNAGRPHHAPRPAKPLPT